MKENSLIVGRGDGREGVVRGGRRTARLLLAVGLLCFTVCAKTSELPGGARQQQQQQQPAPAEAGAQQQGAAPSVDQVLDKLTNALGGREAMARLSTMTFKGTVEVPGSAATGSVVMNVKAPDKVAVDVSFPAQHYSKRQVFDGAAGWEREQRPGGRPVTREIKGLELESLRRESDIYRYFKLRELYPEMKMIGPTKVDDREAFEIEATTSEGRVEKMYFDAASGLLLVNDAATVRNGQTIPYRIYYDDYKQQNGVTLPLTYTLFSPSDDGDVAGVIMRFKEVKMNEPLSDELFGKPR